MKNFIKKMSIVFVISGIFVPFLCEAFARREKIDHQKFIRLYKPDQDFAQAWKNLEGNSLSGDVLQDPEAIILVYGKKASQIQGVCAFGVSKEYKGSGYIDTLSVLHKYQGQGVGRALLNASVCSLYQEHGVREITLCSVHSAVPFYQRAGFEFDGLVGTLKLR